LYDDDESTATAFNPQLSKNIKTGDGVKGVSLDVFKGELVTLLGPSGCGKTTVLRAVGGFLEPDSGDIRIEGRSVLKVPPEKRPTAMVFQSYNLWPHMTVYDNLAFGLKIRGRKKEEIRAAVDKVLHLVRLPGTENKMPSQLSGGQQQRIAVARALLLDPAVLLLDEPFSALDAKLRLEMREELREIQSSTGLTMVFVTHDQEEALSISDRIVVMNSGRIEQLDPPQRIYDHPESLFVAQFIGRMNFLPARGEGGMVDIQGRRFKAERPVEDDVTAAIRPEDIFLLDAEEAKEQPSFQATIRQVMVLGHYAEVTADTVAGPVKLFVPREQAATLEHGQSVPIGFMRVTAFHR